MNVIINKLFLINIHIVNTINSLYDYDIIMVIKKHISFIYETQCLKVKNKQFKIPDGHQNYGKK